jgi:hypothetical protein
VKLQAAVATVAITTTLLGAPHDSGEERLCKYFPVHVTYHRARVTDSRWRDLATSMPQPLRRRAVSLDVWIQQTGHKRVSPQARHRLRLVVESCN